MTALIEAAHEFVVEAEHPPGVAQDCLPRLGGTRRTRALHQRAAEQSLQTLHLQTDGRLRAAKLLRRVGETSRLHHRLKRPQQIQIDVAHRNPILNSNRDPRVLNIHYAPQWVTVPQRIGTRPLELSSPSGLARPRRRWLSVTH